MNFGPRYHLLDLGKVGIWRKWRDMRQGEDVGVRRLQVMIEELLECSLLRWKKEQLEILCKYK